MHTPLDPLLLSVTDACRMIGVGRTTLYRLFASGEIPFFHCGKRRLVPVDGLRAWAERNTMGARTPAPAAPVPPKPRR